METIKKKPLLIDFNILMFSSQDLENVNSLHNDVVVIKVQIFNPMVSRFLVDNVVGSTSFSKIEPIG